MKIDVSGSRPPTQQYHAEWFQKFSTVESLLHLIVRSKRLLADHVDLLETCKLPADDAILSMEPTQNRFTFLRTVGLVVSTSVVSLNLRDNCWPIIQYVLPMTAALYGVIYSIKAISMFKRKRLERTVSGLLADLDSVESGIRKNVCYLRETNFLRGNSRDKCESVDDKVQKCLESTIKIIRLIYDEVLSLERIRFAEHIESKYQPLEDLSDCVYFQRNVAEFNVDDIKDFLNIYLYFQSQFLTRLCLLIIYRSDEAYTYLRQRVHLLHSAIQLETARLTESIAFSDGHALLRDKLQALKTVDTSTAIDSVALTKVKRGSLDLMCRLIAMTNEYRNTDNRIQSIMSDHRLKKDVFMDIAQHMIKIEQSLIMCQEDYRRLKLTYDKFLFTTFRMKTERKAVTAVDNEASDDISSDASVGANKQCSQYENNEENSDYFALRDSDEIISISEDEIDHAIGVKNHGNFDDELEQLDLKLSRTYFAPVLKQLKTKINPINDAMKERELKFLMAKGMDRDRIVNSAKATIKGDDLTCAVDNDSDSDVSIVLSRSKPRINYDEMRLYLQQKQQFAMIPPTLPPMHVPGDEDLLE